MAGNLVSRDSTRFVALFQKAHGCIANVQRLDDQIAALFEQRRKALDDMRAVQAQINNEFDRMLELDRVVPADTLSGAEINGNGRTKEAKTAEGKLSRFDGPMRIDAEEVRSQRAPVAVPG